MSSSNRPVDEEPTSLFRSQIVNRRFDEEALQILEWILVSKDVKTLVGVRSGLREFMRSQSISVVREIAEKTVEEKLESLEFFVRAFAIIGDVESCLALRYEALALRELKSVSCRWLQVSYVEWLNFAEHSLNAGFNSVAQKACENALVSLHHGNDSTDLKEDELFEFAQVIEKIKKLKGIAMTAAAPQSVQVQAAGYLGKRTIEKDRKSLLLSKETQCTASSLFRNGIKKRNLLKLHALQSRN